MHIIAGVEVECFGAIENRLWSLYTVAQALPIELPKDYGTLGYSLLVLKTFPITDYKSCVNS